MKSAGAALLLAALLPCPALSGPAELIRAKTVEPREDSGGVSYSLQSSAYSLSAGGARAVRVVAAGADLAAAVAAAPAGATLVVDGGVHRGPLRLEKKLCLMGRAGAVLDGGGSGTVVRIAAAGVELRGFVIRGSGGDLMAEDAGVRVEKAAGVRLAQLELRDCLFGIFATGCEKLQVEGCGFVGKDLPDVRRGDALHAWGCNLARFSGNRIERGRDVVLWYSSGTTFDDNVVSHGRYGVHYMYSDHNTFSRNRFEANQVGAVLMYGKGLEGEGNSFLLARGVGSCGVLVKDADDIFLTGNRFVANATGLLLDGAPLSPGGDARAFAEVVAIVLGLAASTLAVGLMLSVLLESRARVVGAAFAVWLALVYLCDLGAIGLTLAQDLGPAQVFLLGVLNPVQQARILGTLALTDRLEVLGPAGIYAVDTFGAGGAALLLGWMMAAVTAGCLAFGYLRFRRTVVS